MAGDYLCGLRRSDVGHTEASVFEEVGPNELTVAGDLALFVTKDGYLFGISNQLP